MGRKKLLLLLKPFDVYPGHVYRTPLPIFPTLRHWYCSDEFLSIFVDLVGKVSTISGVSPPPVVEEHYKTLQILNYLDHRRKVHREAVSFCQNILQKKAVDWEPIMRSELSSPIRNVDLVITVGGDGTLLQASHYMDDSVPLLGVNSDPTKSEEVEEFSDEFDATRSTGYLCASTVGNFEQMLDEVLEGTSVPSEVSRLSIHVNSEPLPIHALNDILIAHPCPAAVSRFSFRIKKDNQPCSLLINSRSSGLRISTAAGSTAAMLSAGGARMPILSRDLQYMVREAIAPGASSSLMHGFVKHDQSMATSWFCKEGMIYIDGSHEYHPIKHGTPLKSLPELLS